MCHTNSKSPYWKVWGYLFALLEMGGGKTLQSNELHKPLGININILPLVDMFISANIVIFVLSNKNSFQFSVISYQLLRQVLMRNAEFRMQNGPPRWIFSQSCERSLDKCRMQNSECRMAIEAGESPDGENL